MTSRLSLLFIIWCVSEVNIFYSTHLWTFFSTLTDTFYLSNTDPQASVKQTHAVGLLCERDIRVFVCSVCIQWCAAEGRSFWFTPSSVWKTEEENVSVQENRWCQPELRLTAPQRCWQRERDADRSSKILFTSETEQQYSFSPPL